MYTDKKMAADFFNWLKNDGAIVESELSEGVVLAIETMLINHRRCIQNEILLKTNLQSQAPATAEFYMTEAISSIDRLFGEGHAKANPVLVAEFMHTSALDLDSMVKRESHV